VLQPLVHPVARAGRAVDLAGVTPVRHFYFWLRWQTFGIVLPDEGQEGSR
jgi:hypothetical protein